MITFNDIKVSNKAFRAARKLAKKASKDSHFQPCPEDHIESNLDDVGHISEEHKDSWCSTTHFELLYATELSEITDNEVVRLTGDLDGLSHLDLGRYEGIYIPLRDAFFEEWENLTGFYEKTEEAIKNFKS